MGVFDFIYKSRPKQGRVYHRPSPHPQRPSSQYQQRTATFVNHRSNSLPNDQEPALQSEKHYDKKSPATRSYNQKHDSSHHHKYQHKPKPDTYDYHSAPKNNDFQDDFTRLSRLEIKIDDYIKRHHQLSIEINNIEQDLGLILNEFNDEFQDSIVKSGNRHTFKIGERILDKLNNFCSIDNSVVFKTAHHDGKPQQQLPSRVFSPASIPKSRKSSTESEQSNRVNQHLQNRKVAAPPPPPVEPSQAKMTANILPTSPLINSHNGHHQKNRDFTFNMTGIEKTNDNYGSPHLVKAHYAVVNTSTPYTDDAPKLTHYKSTPSLVQQSMVYDNSAPQYLPVDDTYIANNDPNQSRMYINMSMIMHSDHPVIEHCFRRIEILRPRIMGYKSEHKLSAYKDLSNEIWRLSNRLDTVDCGNDSIAQQDKNIAKCELFNLEGVLERAIQCTNEECVICNSFIYKQEVSV